MRTETTDLVALFTKNNGGKHNWRYKGVDTQLAGRRNQRSLRTINDTRPF